MSHYNTRQQGHSKPPYFGDHEFVCGVRVREPDDFHIHQPGLPSSGQDIGFGNLLDAFGAPRPTSRPPGRGRV